MGVGSFHGPARSAGRLTARFDSHGELTGGHHRRRGGGRIVEGVDVGVAELGGDIGNRSAVAEQRGRVRVPQIVEPVAGEPGLFHGLGKAAGGPVGIKALALGIEEDPFGQFAPAVCEFGFLPFDEEAGEGVGEFGAHIDSAGDSGFGGPDRALGERALDQNLAAGEVDVVPSEGEGFARPDTGASQAEQERVDVGVDLLSGAEERAEFGRGEGADCHQAFGGADGIGALAAAVTGEGGEVSFDSTIDDPFSIRTATRSPISTASPPISII
jgi:hypothetical protein